MDLINKTINNQTKFSLLQFLWCFENCVIFGFMVLYLTYFGFSSYQSGTLISIIALFGIFIQPFLGFLCDYKYSPKKIITISCFGILITSLFLPIYKNSFILLSCNIFVLSFFCYSQGGIIDSWIVSSSSQFKEIKYNTTRSFGSVGYSIAAVLIGKIISTFGYKIVFTIHYIVVIMIAITTYLCPTTTFFAKTNSIVKNGYYYTVKKLLFKKEFLLFCISVCFFQIALRTTATFLAVFIKYMGGNETSLGISVFLSAIFEIPAMLFCSRFRGSKTKLLKLYTFGTIILFIRLLQLILFPSTLITVAMQIPQAIATGIYIGSFVEYLYIILDQKQIKSGIALGYALTTGIGGSFGVYIGGLVIEKAGIINYVVFSEIMIVISFFLVYMLIKTNDNKFKIKQV